MKQKIKHIHGGKQLVNVDSGNSVSEFNESSFCAITGFIQNNGVRITHIEHFRDFTSTDFYLKITETFNYCLKCRSHFIRAQFMRRHGNQCVLCSFDVQGRGEACRSNSAHCAAAILKWQFSATHIHLKNGPLDKGLDRRSTAQKCALIRVEQKFSCVPILLTHYKYGDDQCSDRTDCLYPSRPAFLCQAKMVASDCNSNRSPDECNAKNYIGFLHESIQSCLKGILA